MSSKPYSGETFVKYDRLLCEKAGVTGYQGEDGNIREAIGVATQVTLMAVYDAYLGGLLPEERQLPQDEQIDAYIERRGGIVKITQQCSEQMIGFLANPPADRNQFYRNRDQDQIAKLRKVIAVLGTEAK